MARVHVIEFDPQLEMFFDNGFDGDRRFDPHTPSVLIFGEQRRRVAVN